MPDPGGEKKYNHLFGPVPSRRLGRSLGVDLVPYKTCSLNCIFCQVGSSEETTSERKEYIPTADVLEELGLWFAEDGQADAITLSGSGEPTLHSRFGDVLRFIKNSTETKAVLLSNGTLFYLPEVRRAAVNADIVKLTLSAWDEDSFRRVHRPARDVTFKKLVTGEQAFRQDFKGELWLEVFVLAGINSADDDIRRIAAIADTINPDCIHLNTAVRPTAESYAKPVLKDRLEELRDLLGPKAEIIARFSREHESPFAVNTQEVLSMLERRPCTAEQIAEVFAITPSEVSKHLGLLLDEGRIRSEDRNGRMYYTAH